MGRDRELRGQQGFSLIELLVALLILGFVALGIASLFSHGIALPPIIKHGTPEQKESLLLPIVI